MLFLCHSTTAKPLCATWQPIPPSFDSALGMLPAWIPCFSAIESICWPVTLLHFHVLHCSKNESNLNFRGRGRGGEAKTKDNCSCSPEISALAMKSNAPSTPSSPRQLLPKKGIMSSASTWVTYIWGTKKSQDWALRMTSAALCTKVHAWKAKALFCCPKKGRRFRGLLKTTFDQLYTCRQCCLKRPRWSQLLA